MQNKNQEKVALMIKISNFECRNMIKANYLQILKATEVNSLLQLNKLTKINAQVPLFCPTYTQNKYDYEKLIHKNTL